MDQLKAHDPRTLGPYRVLGRLGVGGMGQVFLAVDAAGRRVAVKVVLAELAQDEGFRERFRREARMAAAAPAWFTAPVVAADADAEQPWLATELIDGPSLQARVALRGPLPADETVRLAGRIAAGLADMHAGGLVHRDVKPSNVLLSADGPRLIDFGIARAADASTMTRTGHLLGTPSFMSPEQVAGTQVIGPPTDVFSMGSVLAFAATGQSPFVAETAAGSLYRVAHSDPDLAGLTGWAREIVQACLIRDAAARPTAAQLRDAIASGSALPGSPTVDADPPTLVGPPPEARRYRRRLVVGLVAAVFAAAAVLVVVWPWSDDVPSDVRSEHIIDAGTDHRFGAGTPRFMTPTGNIICELSDGAVRCDVQQRTWQVPARPAGCTGIWATGTAMSGTGSGVLSCVPGAFAGPPPAVLAYGDAIQLAAVTCVSRSTGVRCENRTTLHGFSLSRTNYELF